MNIFHRTIDQTSRESLSTPAIRLTLLRLSQMTKDPLSGIDDEVGTVCCLGDRVVVLVPEQGKPIN